MKNFFSEIKPMGAQYIDYGRKNRAPIAIRGPKWLQNDDLKIFRVLYRTPGIVQNPGHCIEISGHCIELSGHCIELRHCIEISGHCIELRALYRTPGIV